jgi:hypothetical protein
MAPPILVTGETAAKTKLISAAIDLLWERSYASVSVEDICEKAGVNRVVFITPSNPNPISFGCNRTALGFEDASPQSSLHLESGTPDRLMPQAIS